MTGDPWTQAEDDSLATAWDAGDTASQIELQLPNRTRNAVIGRARRLGLLGRPSPIIRGGAQEEPAALQLDRECEWPTGHPGERGFHFCGAPVKRGKPYCAEHQKLARRKYEPSGGKMVLPRLGV